MAHIHLNGEKTRLSSSLSYSTQSPLMTHIRLNGKTKIHVYYDTNPPFTAPICLLRQPYLPLMGQIHLLGLIIASHDTNFPFIAHVRLYGRPTRLSRHIPLSCPYSPIPTKRKKQKQKTKELAFLSTYPPNKTHISLPQHKFAFHDIH